MIIFHIHSSSCILQYNHVYNKTYNSDGQVRFLISKSKLYILNHRRGELPFHKTRSIMAEFRRSVSHPINTLKVKFLATRTEDTSSVSVPVGVQCCFVALWLLLVSWLYFLYFFLYSL